MKTRPEVLLSSSDYLEDIKVRWQIHLYEVEKLQEDLTKLGNLLGKQLNSLMDKAYYSFSDQ